MATDNRTTLNNCSATTGWTGDDTVSVDSTTGQSYQGGSSLSWQATNSVTHMYTTSIGGTRDLSNAQVWMLVKDNLIQTQANNGMLLVIGDGTNRVGYRVGGYDAIGLPLRFFYNSYRLDVSNKPGFNTFAGTEANLNEAAITSAGVGTLHLAKANGAIDNTWIDRLSFIVNGNYALTINAGTVGTPITFATVVGEDRSNGWGLINNPVGKQYSLFGSTEWGTPSGTANSYFEDSDFQLYLLGFQVGTGNFLFRTIGNSTGTNSFVLNNGVIVNVDTRATLNFTNNDVDLFKLDAITFTNCGAITFPTHVANDRFVDNCIFNNCAQVDMSTISATNITFNGTTDANGAILLDTNGQTTNQTEFRFNSDGTGHAIYITQTGTYNFTDWFFDGYGSTGTTDAVIYNNSGGAVTINVTGGDTPTYRNGTSATTTINVSVPISITGLTEASYAAMVGVGGAEDGNIVLSGYANSSGTVSGTFGGTTPQNVRVVARNGGIVAAVLQDDGTVFTDYTLAARNRTSPGSGSANDVALLPAVPAVSDAVYFGGIDEFETILFDITTAGTTYVLTWEYWNGSTWSALTVVDGTNSFQTTGWNTVEFTAPGDWTTTSVNSLGPYYYVRARVTTGGGTGASAETLTLKNTVQYQSFEGTGTIASGTGLTVNAVWQEDNINQ